MIHWVRHMVLLFALAGLFCSCSQVEDARHVVAEADSLRTAGIAYDDSLSIAEAAATLSHVRNIYPTDYARANYYYGRLLRTRGDHPAAMQAFLRVIHSRSEDHAVKGRSYSNIATLCHWADEYALSYEMYQKCAQQFWLCPDSVMYYYALNAMAFELARQQLLRESIDLTNKIEQECTDEGVLTKIWETRAEAFRVVEQYDSAIYCADILNAKGFIAPSGEVVKAQSFLALGIEDSAVYYAQIVMESPYANNTDKYNVLYILSNNDSTIEKDDIRALNSQRADIALQELTPESEKLAIAVDYLLQDLNRKPDLTWLWAILVTLLIIGVPSSIYISHKRKTHQLYSQKTTAAQEEHRILSEQNRQLEEKQIQRRENAMAEIDVFCNSITEENIKQKLCWKEFDQMCTIVNQRMFGFVDKLRARGITSDNEIKICILLVIGHFNTKQMAMIVPSTYDSFKTTKSGVAKKLNISGKNMRSILLKIALEH